MRVILDANVVIRMLLGSDNPARAVDVILEAGLSQIVTFLVTSELRREVLNKIQQKRYLSDRIVSDRIVADDAIDFLDEMSRRGTVLPTRVGSPSIKSRDPKDDYVLAYAETGRADYVVTHDEDLLVLDGRFTFRIVRPPELLAVLREHGLIP